MRPWHSTVQLTAPLRNARIASPRESTSQSIRQEDSEAKLRAKYEEGVRDGEKKLREQLVQQRSELIALQQGVFRSLVETLPSVRTECENALIEIAIEAARKLVAGFPIEAEMIERVVKEALEHAEAGQSLKVLLHAEDLAMLQRANAPLLLNEAGGEKIVFEPSPDVTRGGCLVVTRFGVLDALRETKLDLLKASLNT